MAVKPFDHRPCNLQTGAIGLITWLLGGYEAARLEHFLLTIGYFLFFVVHITQVVKAGWNNFRAMVTGFEVVNVSEPSPALQVTTAVPAAAPPASPQPTPSSTAGAAT